MPTERFTVPRRVLALATLLTLTAPLAVLAQVRGQGANDPGFAAIPTLDGVGFATLAGALAMAGSWVVMRRKRGGDK